MAMNRRINYKQNNDILYANTPKFYITAGRPCDSQKEDKSGYIDLTVTAKDNLYIGSGFKNADKASRNGYAETDKTPDGAIIPGSSLKGCIRYLASVVSDGCVDDLSKKDKGKGFFYPFRLIRCTPTDKKDRNTGRVTPSNRCIICDMFGMMGRRSKIDFSDLICENPSYVTEEVNSQFGPSINDEKYHDNGEVYGYKVYRNECEKYIANQRDMIEAVCSGCVFKGKLFFKNLTDNELNLLCFALGLDETINPKIGGYKNEGYGQIEIRGNLYVNGKEQSAKKCAEQYQRDSRFYNNINTLKDTLKPYGGDKV